MIFNTASSYNASSSYDARTPMTPEDDIERPIEPPIVKMGEMGQSVPEGGRFGHLIQTATGAIRAGVGTIELATSMGGAGEPVGPSSYGKEARTALREMSKATETKFVSVHTPVQIGNLSGFNPQQGFSDEQRKSAVDEIKKAVDFSADVTGGSAVVVHTGEYPRAISEANWAKNPDGSYKFLGFNEEPGRAITYMVDSRTGRIMSDVRKSQVIREPVYKEAEKDITNGEDVDGNPHVIHKGDWLDSRGRYIDPSNPNHLFKRVPAWDQPNQRFETRKLTWNEIEERTEWYNNNHPDEKRSAEEMAFRIQMETQMLQYRGSSLFHGQRYDQHLRQKEALEKSLEYYKKIEAELPKDEAWKIMQRDNPAAYSRAGGLVPDEMKMPSDVLQESLDQLEKEMQYVHEASASADAQAASIQDTIEHVMPVSKYAEEQSMKSYAEVGIYAMKQSDANPHAKKPVFIAPENIFPEMGYGSHPEELIELVQNARKEMVNMLTSPTIPDPHKRFNKDGKLIQVTNPFYNPDMNKKQAEKEASEHIRATLDTQHLGMWRANFVPQEGESKEQTDKRFHQWYKEEVNKLADADVLGHIHLVDSLATGHEHLPAGQGDLPLKDVIASLKKKGFGGTIITEGYGEDRFEQSRGIKQAWSMFGSPVYSHFVSGMGRQNTWGGVESAWYGQVQPPMYIFGAYSPSNEWVLWSEVPME